MEKGGSALTLKISGGFDYLNGDTRVYLPNILQNEQASPNPGDVIRTKEDNFNSNVRGSLVAVNEAHNFTFTTELGFSRFHRYDNLQQIRGQGLPPGQNNIGLAKIQSIPVQRIIRVTDFGLFGQEQVNWKDKLIATVGLRGDRSSLNYQQHQYYLFPLASLAINLTNFDFSKLII